MYDVGSRGKRWRGQVSMRVQILLMLPLLGTFPNRLHFPQTWTAEDADLIEAFNKADAEK